MGRGFGTGHEAPVVEITELPNNKPQHDDRIMSWLTANVKAGRLVQHREHRRWVATEDHVYPMA